MWMWKRIKVLILIIDLSSSLKDCDKRLKSLHVAQLYRGICCKHVEMNIYIFIQY